MSYTKIGWKNYPDKTTPINAENLNVMDNQIEALSNSVPFKFGIENGQYGYYKEEAGADTFVPFKTGSGGDGRPLGHSFTEIFPSIELTLSDRTIEIQNFSESFSTALIVALYYLSTARANDYTYDNNYVSTEDDSFTLITDYSISEKEEEIDEGKLVSIEILNSNFSSIESVVIKDE